MPIGRSVRKGEELGKGYGYLARINTRDMHELDKVTRAKMDGSVVHHLIARGEAGALIDVAFSKLDSKYPQVEFAKAVPPLVAERLVQKLGANIDLSKRTTTGRHFPIVLPAPEERKTASPMNQRLSTGMQFRDFVHK